MEMDVDRQISMTHRRLVKAMEGRLPSMSAETKERYFAVLAPLVAKLETVEKPLRDVIQEMMTEAMSFVLQEIQSS